jgi:hypothetical protein
LNRAGRAQGILGPRWAGPGHFFVARFEPWSEISEEIQRIELEYETINWSKEIEMIK